MIYQTHQHIYRVNGNRILRVSRYKCIACTASFVSKKEFEILKYSGKLKPVTDLYEFVQLLLFQKHVLPQVKGNTDYVRHLIRLDWSFVMMRKYHDKPEFVSILIDRIKSNLNFIKKEYNISVNEVYMHLIEGPVWKNNQWVYE